MGDSRPDPFAGPHGRLVPTEVPYPPTHPLGHRAQQPVTLDELGPDRVQPRDVIAAEQVAFYGRDRARGTWRDLPKPPPAELGFDPEKWARMTRAERRAVTRYAKGKR